MQRYTESQKEEGCGATYTPNMGGSTFCVARELLSHTCTGSHTHALWYRYIYALKSGNEDHEVLLLQHALHATEYSCIVCMFWCIRHTACRTHCSASSAGWSADASSPWMRPSRCPRRRPRQPMPSCHREQCHADCDRCGYVYPIKVSRVSQLCYNMPCMSVCHPTIYLTTELANSLNEVNSSEE